MKIKLYSSIQWLGKNSGFPATFLDVDSGNYSFDINKELKLSRFNTTKLFVITGKIYKHQNKIEDIISLGKNIDFNININEIISYPIYNIQKIMVNYIIPNNLINQNIINNIILLNKFNNVYFYFDIPPLYMHTTDTLKKIRFLFENNFETFADYTKFGIIFPLYDKFDKNAFREVISFAIAKNISLYIRNKNMEGDFYEDTFFYRYTL